MLTVSSLNVNKSSCWFRSLKKKAIVCSIFVFKKRFAFVDILNEMNDAISWPNEDVFNGKNLHQLINGTRIFVLQVAEMVYHVMNDLNKTLLTCYFVMTQCQSSQVFQIHWKIRYFCNVCHFQNLQTLWSFSIKFVNKFTLVKHVIIYSVDLLVNQFWVCDFLSSDCLNSD